jgi:hypothetical protein
MAEYIERDFKEAYKLMKERALDAEHDRDALVKALEAIAAENNLDPSSACKIAREALASLVGAQRPQENAND